MGSMPATSRAGVPGAVSLARPLLAFARERKTGVLAFETERGPRRIALVGGAMCAVELRDGDASVLGDALLRDGALDADAHRAALEEREPRAAPVGRFLLDRGLVTRPALELALRRQLRDRLVQVLGESVITYAFAAGAAELAAPAVDEPMTTQNVLLCALRAHVGGMPRQATLGMLPSGRAQLTLFGRALTQGAMLWPEELVASTLLRAGATLGEIAQASRAGMRGDAGSERALCFVAALSLLSALRAAERDGPRLALLVRKRAQMAGSAAAHALLDVPRHAEPDEARKALRRLAHSVHPDALAPDAPAALRRASSEVLCALIDAERSLRVR